MGEPTDTEMLDWLQAMANEHGIELYSEMLGLYIWPSDCPVDLRGEIRKAMEKT